MTDFENRLRGIRLLAIDPGSRLLGWVILFGYELEDYGVYDAGKRPYHLRSATIIEYLSKVAVNNKVNEVACERAFQAPKRNTAALQVVVKSIEKWAEGEKLLVVRYSPGEWKKTVCGNGMASKEEVAWFIHLWYPELPVGCSEHVTDAIGVAQHHLGLRKLELMEQT